MNAVLIIIGDEILSGNTLDTNSNFIAQQLKSIGVKLVEIHCISDTLEAIENTLNSAFEKTNLVFTTGGLGPTRDDKTVEALANYFKDTIVTDEKTLEHLKNYLEKRGRGHLFEINKGQARVLSTATVLQNDYGTAPCQMIQKNGKIVSCMPGVPYEVKPLMKDKIIPYIQSKFSLEHEVSRTISVVGIPESLLAQKIEEWELALPKNLSLSYLPIGTRIKLVLHGSDFDEQKINSQIDTEILKLEKIIGNHIISKSSDKIEEILKDLLQQNKMTLSVAESCTGGGVARLVTSVAGSSAYFFGGVCTYATEQKNHLLGVSKELIQEKTVVSKEVAQAMSEGCQKLFNSDIAVSTTGVAGPNSDEFNNEIGLVYYSIRIKNQEKTHQLYLPYMERNDFMNFVSQKVLQSIVESFLIVS